ncbi:MAG TPA: DegV family protein [Candidatus Gallacutalibacter pullicola]|uniref:DegV family protein n=1 Tax=Candidatus Gallacutalibacter pullicola TaxID=2840830 RepID=A0A9D1J1N6_9FIRM|nr:DegV family protein [Candidatus Gallacutalibacter pullicola]
MIALVTDSTAYLTKQEAISLGVHVVPTGYTIGGKQFQETYGDCNGDFEPLLARTPNCTTSQAPIHAFSRVFKKLVSNGYDVLCIVMSSRLSGTYSCASIAAQPIPEDRIRVVDSLAIAGSLNLLMKYASALVREGHPLDNIARMVEDARSRAGIIFSVSSMDTLRRSGRIGIIRQSVGTILNIRPVLLCEDGAISACGSARGSRELIHELTGHIPKDAKKIILQHLSDSALMEPLAEELRALFPEAEFSAAPVGPVIAINIGLGAVGVSWIR